MALPRPRSPERARPSAGRLRASGASGRILVSSVAGSTDHRKFPHNSRTSERLRGWLAVPPPTPSGGTNLHCAASALTSGQWERPANVGASMAAAAQRSGRRRSGSRSASAARPRCTVTSPRRGFAGAGRARRGAPRGGPCFGRPVARLACGQAATRASAGSSGTCRGQPEGRGTSRKAGDASVLEVGVAQGDVAEAKRQASWAAAAEARAQASLRVRYPQLAQLTPALSEPLALERSEVQWRERILAVSGKVRTAQAALEAEQQARSGTRRRGTRDARDRGRGGRASGRGQRQPGAQAPGRASRGPLRAMPHS